MCLAKYDAFGIGVVADDLCESVESFTLIFAHLDEGLLYSGVSDCG